MLQDRPGLSGTDITNPKQEHRPADQPAERHLRLHGRRAPEVPGRDARDRPARARQLAPGQQPRPSSRRPLRGRPRQRDRLAADHRLQENPDGIDGRTGAQISGLFSIQEAQDLAKFLKIGALPIELKLISQTTVSATLGQQALDQGLKAGNHRAGAGRPLPAPLLPLPRRRRRDRADRLRGLLLRADQADPDHADPAGHRRALILTIGVAADANIVIFERIKEEVRAGKSIPSAIAAGYRKGIATIIDANVVTLLTAFILFVLATAGRQGLRLHARRRHDRLAVHRGRLHPGLPRAVRAGRRFMRSPALHRRQAEQRVRWHFDFMGASRWFFSMSGTILLVGAIALATKQLNLGIDFKSGTRIKVALAQPATVDQVRTTLGGAGVTDAQVQSVTDPQLGANVFQIQTQDPGPGPGRQGPGRARPRTTGWPRTASTTSRSGRPSASRSPTAPPTRSSSRCS